MYCSKQHGQCFIVKTDYHACSRKLGRVSFVLLTTSENKEEGENRQERKKMKLRNWYR